MTQSRQILRTALAALVLASIVGCEKSSGTGLIVDYPLGAEPTNTLPIEEFPVAAEWSEHAKAGAGPAILISQTAPLQPDDKHQEVRLILVNPTKEPIEYFGYTIGSWSDPPPTGDVSPLYSIEKLDNAGVWQPDFVGWCGTGAGTMRVPPGHAGEFPAYVEPGGRWRVGVEVSRHSRSGTTVSALWSPVIDAREESATLEAP